jgi:PEP-utilizing family enzyme
MAALISTASTEGTIVKYRLSLSGETPTPEVLAQFDGVGLVRSEYVLRAAGEFITQPSAQRRLGDYVATVASLQTADLWYRTSELTSQEANTLVGVDKIFHEADFMKGRRGIRRARELPEAFETELRVLAEVAREHPQVHVLLPFLRDADDFGFAVDMLERVGWPNRIGTMIEIPSALLEVSKLCAMGATNLLVGLNDLSSLMTGTSRQDRDMKLHSSVWWAVNMVASAVDGKAEWGIGGNLSQSTLDRAEAAGVPYATVHYSDLTVLRGIPADELPSLDFVKRTKEFTREQIRIFEQREADRRRAALEIAEINSPTSPLAVVTGEPGGTADAGGLR